MPRDGNNGTFEFGYDQLIVNYNDACIYGRDIGLLRSKSAWLNDSCLHYQLEYLRELYEQRRVESNRVHQATSATSNDGSVLLDPTVVSYFMHQCETDDELMDFLSGYQSFAHTTRIFVPINDSLTSTQQVGQGTHWSLLVVHLDRPVHHIAGARNDTNPNLGVAWTQPDAAHPLNNAPLLSGLHFDSISSSRNRLVAQAVATKLLYTLRLANPTDSKDANSTVQVVEGRAPPQQNGFDCGLHVLATVEVLLLQHDHERNVVNLGAVSSRTVNDTSIRPTVAVGTNDTPVSAEERLEQLFRHRPKYATELRQSMVEDIERRWQAAATSSSSNGQHF